jgi:hypothetical protein
MKLELLTNATVVDDAIMFVSGKSKERLKEPDYDEEQEREAGKITSTTTNLIL